jgi:hypothetical protein
MPRVGRCVARLNLPAYSGRNDYERHKLESDNEVNKSHWNTAKSRKTSQRIIKSRFYDRCHWVPRGSKLVAHNGDIDFDPFCVGVEVDDFGLEIRSVLVIVQPPIDTHFPATISVLATEEGHEGRGYGTAALKVALLYMKEHYSSPSVRVLAPIEKDSITNRTPVEFWE